MERTRTATAKPSETCTRRHRQAASDDDHDVVVIDSDEEMEVEVLPDRRSRVATATPKCVNLLDDSVDGEENRENNKSFHRKRQLSGPSSSNSEAADRALAERLQIEEHFSVTRANKRARNEMMNSRSVVSTPAAAAVAVAHRRQQHIAASQNLRKEQDKAYEESLLADQWRDIERREAEEREETTMLETARKASVVEDARSLVARTGGEPPTNARGVVTLRFALPNGKRVDRRFLSGHTLEIVRAYLVVYFHDWGIEIENFGLITNFPTKEFGERDENLTLEAAGFASQTVVMVRDLDA